MFSRKNLSVIWSSSTEKEDVGINVDAQYFHQILSDISSRLFILIIMSHNLLECKHKALNPAVCK